MRIGGLSDLTGARYVHEAGFTGIANDAEMLIATAERIMRRLVGPATEEPSVELVENDPEEAERLERLADGLYYQDLTAHRFAAREIVVQEVNRRLGLLLPPVVGTTTLAAEVYDWQRQRGLTAPEERIHIEYRSGSSPRPKFTLGDVRLA